MLRKSSAGCSLTNLWQMLLVNATSRIFFFLHPKSNPVDGLCVGGPGVFACSSLQMSAGDMICHADSQPRCLLDYRWPAKRLTLKRSRPRRWQWWEHYPPPPLPVYNGRVVWSMACVPVEPGNYKARHTHSDAHNYTTKGLLWRPGNTQRSSGNTLGHTLTHESIIQAWRDVWCIVQIHCSHSAELLECLPVQAFVLIKHDVQITDEYKILRVTAWCTFLSLYIELQTHSYSNTLFKQFVHFLKYWIV